MYQFLDGQGEIVIHSQEVLKVTDSLLELRTRCQREGVDLRPSHRQSYHCRVIAESPGKHPHSHIHCSLEDSDS
jgi:hypothetical protein